MRGWQRAGQARRALRRVDLHMFALMFGVKYACILVKPIGATIVDHGRHGGSADLAHNQWSDFSAYGRRRESNTLLGCYAAEGSV